MPTTEAPALRASRVGPAEVLKEQERGLAGERRAGLGQALVVTQPFMNDRHREQQHALQRLLAERYRTDPGVRPVDLGGARRGCAPEQRLERDCGGHDEQPDHDHQREVLGLAAHWHTSSLGSMSPSSM